jgi:signal transduction histidine kinase
MRQAELRTLQEQQLLEEAQQTAREKADLLAVVAHELRTPLTAQRMTWPCGRSSR